MDENFAIAKAIIMNQLCVEANEDLKQYPFYRQELKHYLNKANTLLEKRLPEFDEAYNQAEYFLRYTQSRIELFVPLLVKLQVDELIYLSHFLEYFEKDKTDAVKTLTEKLRLLNRDI